MSSCAFLICSLGTIENCETAWATSTKWLPQSHLTQLSRSSCASWHIFERPCQEYDDLQALLSRPGFRYLALSLLLDSQNQNDWASLSNGPLHAALELATALELLDFPWQLNVDQDLELDLLPPLRTMLPLSRWPALRYLGLTGLLMAHDELVCLLRGPLEPDFGAPES